MTGPNTYIPDWVELYAHEAGESYDSRQDDDDYDEEEE